MSVELFKKAIEELKNDSNKKKFSQSVDVIVTLKDIDLKKTEQQVDFYTTLPNGIGKTKKICGLVGPELIDDATAEFDKAINQPDFEKLSKAEIKKLADDYDFFVAQATIMPKVAAAFGRLFGPRGKMPNPKAGCVVPPKANLKPLKERLSQTIRLKTKTNYSVQAIVGVESMDTDKLAENANALFDALIHHLPQEKNNVKSVYVKLTMSKTIKVM